MTTKNTKRKPNNGQSKSQTSHNQTKLRTDPKDNIYPNRYTKSSIAVDPNDSAEWVWNYCEDTSRQMVPSIVLTFME